MLDGIMRLSRLLIVLPILCVSVACSKNPRDVAISQKNKETFLDDIKDMKGLTVDEARLLIAYQMRIGMGQALGAHVQDPAGKTVGELLTQLKKEASEQKIEAERQSRLAADAKAKADASAEQLRKALDLSVFEKGFIPSNIQAERFRDYITIKTVYQNNSPKDIRAFRGTVKFADLFGTEIYSSALTISDPIAAGAKANWSGSIEYNQFESAHQRLRNTELKDMKVVWMPESIIFADGSKIGADEQSMGK